MTKKPASFFPKIIFQSFLYRKVLLLLLLLLTSPNNKIGSEKACNTTATLEKLSCTDYVDFGKCQDRFGQFSWTTKDSKYLDNKLKVFKREIKDAEFRLRQNFDMGEANFNQFIRQRNQLAVAADNFLTEQKLLPVLHSTLSKDMEEQLKLAHKVTDVVDCPNRRICVKMLRSQKIQGGQPRDLLCSSSSIRTEEGGRKISTNYLCQL